MPSCSSPSNVARRPEGRGARSDRGGLCEWWACASAPATPRLATQDVRAESLGSPMPGLPDSDRVACQAPGRSATHDSQARRKTIGCWDSSSRTSHGGRGSRPRGDRPSPDQVRGRHASHSHGAARCLMRPKDIVLLLDFLQVIVGAPTAVNQQGSIGVPLGPEVSMTTLKQLAAITRHMRDPQGRRRCFPTGLVALRIEHQVGGPRTPPPHSI